MAKKTSTIVVDSETRANPDDHVALRLWLRLLTCSNLIEANLRTRLRTDYDATLPRFDLLAQLEREPDGLTMGALTERLMVSGGNVTGLVTQLTKSGLVSRVKHPDSGRTFIVKLTPKGRKNFATMARAHETWVKEMFEGVSDKEVKVLMRSLSALKQSVAEHPVDNG